LAGAPPGAVIIGLSIAPNGLRAAALTLLPSADYLMDDLFHDADGRWQPGEGGSGGPGINWSGGGLGVVRFSGEASVDARYAVVRYDGRGASRTNETRLLPVRRLGHAVLTRPETRPIYSKRSALRVHS